MHVFILLQKVIHIQIMLGTSLNTEKDRSFYL